MSTQSLEIGAMNKLIWQLGEALKAASEHLDYCGYGDSWESECAHDSGLAEKVEEAVEKYEEYCE